jgi:hypothetical protein
VDLLGIEKTVAKIVQWSPETDSFSGTAAVEVETFYRCFNSGLG